MVRNGRPVSEPYARSCTEAICEMPEAITVPEGAWFLAGDFRGESDDSRFWGAGPDQGDHGRREVPLLAFEGRGAPVSKTGARASRAR